MHPMVNNSAAYQFGRTALKPGLAVSGNEETGPVVDRLAGLNGEATPPFARSAALLLFGTCTLASGETLSVAANVQHGDLANGSDMEDYGDAHADAVAVTALTALTDHPFCVKLPVDLTGAKQYVRAQATFTLSESGADSADVAAVFAMGGLEHVPPATGF